MKLNPKALTDPLQGVEALQKFPQKGHGLGAFAAHYRENVEGKDATDISR